MLTYFNKHKTGELLICYRPTDYIPLIPYNIPNSVLHNDLFVCCFIAPRTEC